MLHEHIVRDYNVSGFGKRDLVVQIVNWSYGPMCAKLTAPRILLLLFFLSPANTCIRIISTGKQLNSITEATRALFLQKH